MAWTPRPTPPPSWTCWSPGCASTPADITGLAGDRVLASPSTAVRKILTHRVRRPRPLGLQAVPDLAVASEAELVPPGVVRRRPSPRVAPRTRGRAGRRGRLLGLSLVLVGSLGL